MNNKTNILKSYEYNGNNLDEVSESSNLIKIKEKNLNTPIQAKIKTYTNSFSIILCFIIFPTFLISLILNVQRRNKKKTIISAIIFVLSYVFYVAVLLLNMFATFEQNLILSILAIIMFLSIFAIEIILIIFCFCRKNKTN